MQLELMKITDSDIDALMEFIAAKKSGASFGKAVYEKLPPILSKHLAYFESNHEKDFYLLGLIPAIGSIIHNTHFTYRGGKRQHANLNVIIGAPAASNKSIIMLVNHLFDTIEEGDDSYRIPGDISSSGLIKILHSQDGKGCLVESEIDTLAGSIENQQFGDFSDVLRKGYENETISKFRATEETPLIVENPRFSMVLSGTPEQVKRLIPNYENGLFSRFFFYNLEGVNTWQDWNPEEKQVDNMDELKSDLAFLGTALSKLQDKPSHMTHSLKAAKLVNHVAREWEKLYSHDIGLRPSLFRGVTMALKIATSLSFLRRLTPEGFSEDNTILTDDLVAALMMVSVSLANASQQINIARSNSIPYKLRMFYELLPKKHEFASSEAISLSHEHMDLKRRMTYIHLNDLVGLGMVKNPKKGVWYCT
jgi:hypothetical protein